MKSPLNITVLVDVEYYHNDDPEYNGLTEASRKEMEFFIINALRKGGNSIKALAFFEPIQDFINKLLETKPDLVFNLTQHVRHNRFGEAYISSLLELLNLRYTGHDCCGSLLTMDKKICKDILRANKIVVPDYVEISAHNSVKGSKVRFPVLLKPNFEGGSEGITTSNIVKSPRFLNRPLKRLLNSYQSVIAEEFIEGREITVGIIGNKDKLHVFQPRELLFPKKNKADWILTSTMKHNEAYRKKNGIYSISLSNEPRLSTSIKKTARLVFTVLKLRDYARIDLRVTNKNKIYVVDVNVNPILKPGPHSFFEPWDGVLFHKVINKIVKSALLRYE